MTSSSMRIRRAMAGVALVSIGALFTGPSSLAAGGDAGAQVMPVRSEKLPNVPGKSVTAILVSYAPGGKSPAHHHAGSVLAYVLSGAIRSENSATGPAKVYQAGESFFEPPGSEHLVSENASATEPASLLAIFVADDGAQLTTFDH
ncbi:MAG TPA: cupin domain-containing protein [Geminicoccaceae bacterium]|nr:cupin domain-containing protein [Geminicoccaceae bacterium]